MNQIHNYLQDVTVTPQTLYGLTSDSKLDFTTADTQFYIDNAREYFANRVQWEKFADGRSLDSYIENMERITADVLRSVSQKQGEKIQGRLRQADKIDVKLPQNLGQIEPYFQKVTDPRSFL